MMARMILGWYESYSALDRFICQSIWATHLSILKDDGKDDVRMIWGMMLGWYEGYLPLTLLIWTIQLTSFKTYGKDYDRMMGRMILEW